MSEVRLSDGAALGLALAVVSFLLVVGLTAWRVLGTDTRYAPAYSSRGWNSLSVGDTVATVRGALGAPLSVRDRERDETWHYGEGSTCHSWSGLRVVFDESGRSESLETRSEVRARLGPPLVLCGAFEGEGWLYSEPASGSHYEYREIAIEHGRVVELDAHTHYD